VATVEAALGDTLSTTDLISLVIPPEALPEDGTVFLGQTGYEPATVPNENLQVVGTPITIKIPAATIRKPLQLSFPAGSSPIDITNYHVFLFNGKSYFPVEYSLDASRITVNIDLTDWEHTGDKSTSIVSEIVILGSPLAVFRYVFGAMISIENTDNSLVYNYYTQGFKDLDTNSDLIQKMKNLEEPPIPYFTIACTNQPQITHAVIASELLEGYDDGIVQVTSAKGVEGATSPDTDVKINIDFAHMEMPNDDLIFEQVMDYLMSESQ